jgi:hypothetical protein
MKYSEAILMEIYKAQHERFHQSRNNQLKINVTAPPDFLLPFEEIASRIL